MEDKFIVLDKNKVQTIKNLENNLHNMDSDNCDLEYRLPLLGDSLNLAGLEAITKQIKGGLISEGIFSLWFHPQVLNHFYPKLKEITLM